METTALGKTGLTVGVAGLGCGGNSRLGQGTGKTEAESVALVRLAIDLGVNLIDTAANYGTEAIVGEAVSAVPRDRVVLCTKAGIRQGRELLPAADVIASLEKSLRTLRTEYVDVYQLHGVPPWAYDHAQDKILPALLLEKKKGKIRHLGVTETAPHDHTHDMLSRAVADGVWDTVMLAFNMMHQNARTTTFPETKRRRVGTLLMFVVRNIFSRPGHLQAEVKRLAVAGQIPAGVSAKDEPLDFLLHEAGASSLTDAAYRFVRHEPGVDVVLFGTGSEAHLRANVASICKPPLPREDRDKLIELFGHLVGVGLDLPDGSKP